ncbi:MAG: enoyl-CoA hydratase/isomerase family protein [Alphaproteobacteria bacterium]
MRYFENRPAILSRPEGLRWEVDEKSGAGTIVFDRPPMNVIRFAARAQIAALIEEMDKDPAVRVIVIRGAGGVYSSGGDIAGFLKEKPDVMADMHWNIAAAERAKKPVIAAMEKFAMGVSLELALACDFRLATANTQLALPEINLGTMPGSGGTQRVAHIAGLGRAKEMIMRGRRLSAQEAFQWGLISELVPDGQLDEAIARWVADLASRPSIPLHTLKKVLNATYEVPQSAGMELEGQAFEKIRFNEDFKIGVDAFLNKTKPDFSKR